MAEITAYRVPRGRRRKVCLRLEQREVFVDGPGAGERESLSYSGILITGFEAERQVGETWIPLGADPSEADDERVICQLRDAFRWQNVEPGAPAEPR